MKSIKPGRGPSKMNAVGSAAAALFGVFWCIAACAMGGWIMLPFGLIFIGTAVYQTIYHNHNATSKDRYSWIDIVDSDEESDPLNEKYGRKNDDILDGAIINGEIYENSRYSSNSQYNDNNNRDGGAPGTSVDYCPFCGMEVKGEFDFCPKCGKKLPD